MTSELAAIDPIKLCCMKRQSEHRGPQCPDGKVMCCMCFDRFDVADLHVTDDGKPEDVCKPCAESDTSSKEGDDGAQTHRD